MEIQIRMTTDNLSIDGNRMENWTRCILKDLDLPPCEVSILLTDDEGITFYNKKYFNREGSTNVIAFPMLGDMDQIDRRDFSEKPDSAPLVLGDILISLSTAQREAEEGGISTDERIKQLLIHGLLHLLGYTHETETDQRKMYALEEKC